MQSEAHLNRNNLRLDDMVQGIDLVGKVTLIVNGNDWFYLTLMSL